MVSPRTIARDIDRWIPVEPLSYDESKRYRRKDKEAYESPMFRLKWNLFLGFTISLILATLIGIAYLATQISVKQYRMQQLEESMRNLEVQISHAQAENLGARRDVFFDSGIQHKLNLEYPQVMRFVYFNGSSGEVGAEDLTRALYGLSKSKLNMSGALISF